MPRFRKKPIVIQADQWFRNGDHPEDYSGRMIPAVDEGLVVRYYRTHDAGTKLCTDGCGYIMHDHGWIDTREGGHIVCPGDWIITGVERERYACKPRIFEATYDLVEAEHDAD